MIKKFTATLLLLLAIAIPAQAGLQEDYAKKYGKFIGVEQVDDRHAKFLYESNGIRHVVETEDGFVTTDTAILLDPEKSPSLKPSDTPIGDYMKTHQPREAGVADQLPDGTVILIMNYENGVTLALRVMPDRKVIAAAVIYPKKVRV